MNWGSVNNSVEPKNFCDGGLPTNSKFKTAGRKNELSSSIGRICYVIWLKPWRSYGIMEYGMIF